MSIKKHFRLLFVLLALLFGLGAASFCYIINSNSQAAFRIRRFAGEFLNMQKLPDRPDPRLGLEILCEVLYTDNIPAQNPALVKSGGDNKLVMETPEFTRLFDYANGYLLDLPSGVSFDFTKSPQFTTINGEGFTAVVSAEWSVGEDVSAYIGEYFNRFTVNERFQSENRVSVISDIKRDDYEELTVYIGDFPGYDAYTYLTIKTNSRFFYRCMIKYDQKNEKMPAVIREIAASFRFFKPKGKPVYDLDLHPVIPEGWSPETAALYKKLSEPQNMLWGIFDGGHNLSELEKSLDYKFDIILVYFHLDEEFPAEIIQKYYDEGRIVELTLQLTLNNNENLYAASPVLDMRRGVHYEKIAEFARQAKAFGHPFLFRLNNEMNSDWTSYGGVNNLLDPDLFVENWRMVYKIFEDEGVDNAIWIFNPNDRDCPPARWNSFIAYYPGNEYTHILGLTGYNNGNYYNAVTGEIWREFELIYDTAVRAYGGLFDRFPWVITEFASSSAGGDKVKWINGMFKTLQKNKYPKLSAAVWFNYADYDFRPEYAGQVSRPYWIDETPKILEAFKKGLHK